MKLRLFLDDQIVPIFQGVLRPALKVADHFGPLLLALVPFDDTEEEQVLFLCPGAFLQVRVQIAIPMFPALLRAAINFVRVRVAEVQLLGNYAPVPFSIFPIIGAFLLDEFFQQLRLSFCPAVLSQIVLLQAQPLEHASFGLNSRMMEAMNSQSLMVCIRREVTRSLSMERTPLKSEYLETVQMRMVTSSSLQFFLNFLFLTILRSSIVYFSIRLWAIFSTISAL